MHFTVEVWLCADVWMYHDVTVLVTKNEDGRCSSPPGWSFNQYSHHLLSVVPSVSIGIYSFVIPAPVVPVSFSVTSWQDLHICSVVSCHIVSDRAVYCSQRWLYSFPARPGTCSIIMTFVSHVMKKDFLAKTCVWGIENRIFCIRLHAAQHNTSPTVRKS